MILPQVQNITKDVVSQLRNEMSRIPQISSYQTAQRVSLVRSDWQLKSEHRALLQVKPVNSVQFHVLSPS